MQKHVAFKIGSCSFTLWAAKEKSYPKRIKDSKATAVLRVAQQHFSAHGLSVDSVTAGYLGRVIYIGRRRVVDGVRNSERWLAGDLTPWNLQGTAAALQSSVDAALAAFAGQ